MEDISKITDLLLDNQRQLLNVAYALKQSVGVQHSVLDDKEFATLQCKKGLPEDMRSFVKAVSASESTLPEVSVNARNARILRALIERRANLKEPLLKAGWKSTQLETQSFDKSKWISRIDNKNHHVAGGKVAAKKMEELGISYAEAVMKTAEYLSKYGDSAQLGQIKENKVVMTDPNCFLKAFPKEVNFEKEFESLIYNLKNESNNISQISVDLIQLPDQE